MTLKTTHKIMILLKAIFNDNIINALGWSLFNTLWQGVILAFVVGIILYILRYKSSNLRYIISLFSLLLIVGLSIFNFINNYSSVSDLNAVFVNPDLNIADKDEGRTIFIDIKKQKQGYSILKNLPGFVLKSKLQVISKYFPTIVYLWFIGIIFFQIKFLFSFFYLNRLKRINTWSMSKYWDAKFNKIRATLKLNKTVQFLESNLIKTPMILGYFKPVILIPVELLTGMPSNQIESVIAHELAHIKRNDYIINVLQTIIETIFFFHPAVWYISAKIRDERENCCDDIAISLNNDSIAYAKALVCIQELNLQKHYSAVAFSGRKKHLLNRIKRMIMKPKKTNITDKIIAALIVMAAIMTLSFTYTATTNDYDSFNNILEPFKSDAKIENPAVKENLVQKDIQEPRVVVNDTIDVKHREEIDIENNTVTKTFKNKGGREQKMEFTLQKGKVTNLYIDGKEIPEKDYEKYQPEIDKTVQDLKHAKEDLRKAMKELEDLNVEELRRNIDESMQNVHFDMEKIEAEMAAAMESTKNFDIDIIMKEVEMNLDKLEDFNFDIKVKDLHIDLEQVRKEMEEVRKYIRENIDFEEIRKEIENAHENIDNERIRKELQKAREELSKIDMEEIRMRMEKNLQEFKTYDKQKSLQEMEYKLQELENLELEEK